MAEFVRHIRASALAELHTLAASRSKNWWKDLLALWVPSGRPSGPSGIRLTIRNNELSLYRKGQAVGHVGFLRNATPYLDAPLKYVLGDDVLHQEYARLVGEEFRCAKLGLSGYYTGLEMLREWVSSADFHKGLRRRLVDDLVSENSGVIDLGMRLPAYPSGQNPPRMDCVLLEEAPGHRATVRIAFWQVRIVRPGPLRNRTNLKALEQVTAYSAYLNDPCHASLVTAAYRRTCSLLLQLQCMAVSAGHPLALDPLVRRVADESTELVLDPKPRLAVFWGEADQPVSLWSDHEQRLHSPLHVHHLGQQPFDLSGPDARS